MASLEDDQDVYLRYRQLRMNYYAVLALKARVYLYAGEQAKTLAAARKLLADARSERAFSRLSIRINFWRIRITRSGVLHGGTGGNLREGPD